MTNFDLSHVKPVDVAADQGIRLLNLGPTILVSAAADGEKDVMAAAWCCNLDLSPTKLTVVLSKEHKTRKLLEKTGEFIIQVPAAALAKLTLDVGSVSMNDDPQKLEHCGVELFDPEGGDRPYVKGCCAWMLCKVIPEPETQQKYDLFIADVVKAWADDRVFDGHHWQFEKAGDEWRTLHYVAGGRFYKIGEALDI